MTIGEAFGAIGNGVYSAGSAAGNAVLSAGSYVASGAGKLAGWSVTFAKETAYPALASAMSKVAAFAAGIFSFFAANPPALASLLAVGSYSCLKTWPWSHEP